MKGLAIGIVLSVVLTGSALAGPGDPRLIQGTLEWPPTLSGGEPFVVIRGDDGRVYYADVMAAQRHVQGTLSAGSHITLLGLESTKSHEILGVALGSGDAAALSLAIAQGTPTTPSTASAPASPASAPASTVSAAASTPPAPASTGSAPASPASAPASPASAPASPAPAPASPTSAAAGPPAPPAGLAAVPPGPPEEKRLAHGEEERGVTLRGNVYMVAGTNYFIKLDDGRVVLVDVSKLEPSAARRFRLGSPVTLVAVPIGNRFQATSFIESETGAIGSTPAKPGQ